MENLSKAETLKALEQLIRSNEWKIVKSQLEVERKNLNNRMMQDAINWSESQIKATIESLKVYDNIINCPETLFIWNGGSLQ